MAALNTFHFVLSHEDGSTQLFPGLVIEEARGDVDSPDKLAVEFAGVFGEGYAVKSGLITIGESTYMVNPLTGEWEAATTGITPLGFFNPRLGISSIMSRLRQPQLLVNGEGDGEAHRLGGDLPADALAPLLGDTLADATVRVELTIDAQGSYLLEARVAGPVTPTDLPEVVRVITLSGFNEPVAIEPPIE